VTDRERDVLNLAIDELRTLPPLDRRAVARIVDAAVVARAGGIDETVPSYLPAPRSPFFSPAVIGLVAAAGIVVGFVVRDSVTHPTRNPPPAGSPEQTTALSVDNRGASDLLPIPTQFSLNRPDAKRVELIGDFNGWGAQRVELTRDASGVWSAMVPLIPGRHLYSFVVDDSVVLDPNPGALSAVDPDFKVRRSVIIVGKP
jgi:hypothetical protein